MTDIAPLISNRHHNRVAAIHDDVTEWRRDLHTNPEIGFEEVRTAGIVAEKLHSFGVDEVITGAPTAARFYAEGLRDVTPEGVEAAMNELAARDATVHPEWPVFRVRAAILDARAGTVLRAHQECLGRPGRSWYTMQDDRGFQELTALTVGTEHKVCAVRKERKAIEERSANREKLGVVGPLVHKVCAD